MGPLLPAPSLPTISTWPGGASVPQAASDPRRSSSHFIGGSNPGAVSSSTRLSAAAIAQCAPAAPHRAYPARTMDTAAQMRSHDTAPVANHIKYINPLPIISASVSSPANMVVASRNPPPPRTTPVPSAALGQPVDVSPAHESTSPGSRSRDKRHGCTMCHKAFDRPSTLRKHLLVHTGEKAFSCETCGRRFGVLSNLNRHNRRCALRSESTEPPIETSDGANGSPQSQPISPPSASAESEATTETRATATLESSPVARRCRARAGSAKATVDAASSGGARTPRKRRARRAPSPSTWVPASLQSFDLTPVADACVLPLAPVLPYQSGTVWEERDSYDGDLSERPYHPLGWRGRLPGPGLREFITSGVSSMGRLVLS